MGKDIRRLVNSFSRDDFGGFGLFLNIPCQLWWKGGRQGGGQIKRNAGEIKKLNWLSLLREDPIDTEGRAEDNQYSNGQEDITNDFLGHYIYSSIFNQELGGFYS